jgi:aminoglycoside phosphotransferase (APT) family kinase protein
MDSVNHLLPCAKRTRRAIQLDVRDPRGHPQARLSGARAGRLRQAGKLFRTPAQALVDTADAVPSRGRRQSGPGPNVQWLGERLPESETIALCHGDFRIANVMFGKNEPRVVGVLDWELSTLGHPLVDLAFNTQAWRMAPDENGGLLGLPLDAMGIPSESEFLELYCRLSGATERLTRFHQVFAMFRGAVGSAGVAARGDLGSGVLPDAARVGRHLAQAYANRGAVLIEEEG